MSPTPTMEIPETEPEVRTLKLVEPRVGGMAFEVEARKGGLVIAVTCLGAGTMKVGIAPVGSFDLPCDADKVSHNVNQMDLDKAEKLTFSVDAMPSVTWAVRVQQ